MVFSGLLNLSLSLIALILVITTLKRTSNIIDRLHIENIELKEVKDNAEQRETYFARKIKAIEDIIIEAERKNEFAVIALQNIKKELVRKEK
ncbi:MAG: hypothetical protein ACI4UU_00735 [Clostridia bacterium]